MAAGRHLGFDVIRNSAIRSADPENPTLKPNMKCIGSPVAEIWPFAYLGAYGTPFWKQGRSWGQRWHHSKERWWFPIGSPLWPLRYLLPFGCNLRSNVSDAQINRGVSLWAKISGCSPWSRPLMFGSAESEHPRITNGEIISDVFQPMWSESTNVTDRETDGQRDRQLSIDALHYSASRDKTADFPLPTLFDALARGHNY